MARDFQINGESLVSVRGNVNTAIATKTQLGLAEGPIRVSLELNHDDMQVDAWGGRVPPDVQYMLSAVNISMSLVHFDRSVIDTCLQESMGGAPNIGQLVHAGSRLGNNAARFAAGNHYVGLTIASPVENKPWRFYYAYLTGSPVEIPLGTTKSVITMNWRAIPFTQDPWNAGLGAQASILWDYVDGD